MSNDSSAKHNRQFSVVRGDLLADRYRVEGAIGTGAYGEIFSALDEQTGQRVAIKALPSGVREISQTARGRFHREMMVIRNLDHRNIIGIYDWGETADHVVFMVLEYVEGHTLERIVRNQPMGLDVAVDVTGQIAQGLQAAHERGVIHRDLKPANIMLSERDGGGYAVKILDFGMAKVLSRLGDESIEELTREGMAVGTPRYIAPEQARGLPVGPATDLYALGLLLYEMLTGVQAVTADSVEVAVRAHVSKKPLELAEIEQIPAIIRPVLMKMVEKSAENRFQDAGEVLAALELGQEKRGSGGWSSRLGERRGGFFMPASPAEVVESLWSVAVLLVAWWLLATRFSSGGFGMRVGLGLSIVFVAGLVAYVLDSGAWRFGVWRVMWVVSFVVMGVGLVAKW